jgi:RNA polymerase sigma-70 factor, ECF subfamily
MATGSAIVTGTRGPHGSATHLPPLLREIYEEHAPFVIRSLRYLGVREADLDDTLQEVFLVVYQRLNDYEEKGRARAWLYSISTRVAHAQRRKLGRRRETGAEAFVEAAAAPTQLAQVEDSEAIALGHRLLSQLPPQQREVFLLYEVEDMPMAEIAQALDYPLQTTYSRLHKARERILAEVERLGAENEA